MDKTTLKGLLPKKLRKDLTPAEAILLEKVQKGQRADFKSGDTETDKLKNADNWGATAAFVPISFIGSARIGTHTSLCTPRAFGFGVQW